MMAGKSDDAREHRKPADGRPGGDRRDTGDFPDFTEREIGLADAAWDRIGRAEAARRGAGKAPVK